MPFPFFGGYGGSEMTDNGDAPMDSTNIATGMMNQDDELFKDPYAEDSDDSDDSSWWDSD